MMIEILRMMIMMRVMMNHCGGVVWRGERNENWIQIYRRRMEVFLFGC